jgi:hypothetical protein
MKSIFFALFAFLTVAVMTSCDKKDENPPIITITSPADNTILAKGASFTVKGTVTDDTKLKEIKIGNSFSITTFNSPKRHELDETFTISANQEAGNVKLDVTATDDAGNSSVKSINLIIQ